MLVKLIVGLITYVLIFEVASKAVETMDSSEEQTIKPVDIPIKIGPIESANDRFSIFKKVDDPFLNFIGKVVNVSYLSSQVALNRLKDHSEKVKKIGEKVEAFIENIPTFPIPILDDMSHTRLFD